MQIRWHRDTLEESMKTVQEIEPTLEALKEAFDKEHKLFGVYTDKSEFKFEFQGFDPRIYWNSYLITYNGKIIGFSNGKLLETKNQPPLIFNKLGEYVWCYISTEGIIKPKGRGKSMEFALSCSEAKYPEQWQLYKLVKVKDIIK